MTTHQLIPTKPAVTASPSYIPARGGLLQRKCACGGTPGPSGECAECEKKKRNLQRKANDQSAPGASFSPLRIPALQRKLTIGASNDPLEQEADRVADQVLALPSHPAVSGALPQIQRFSGQPTGQADTAPASVDRVLASSGRPLEPALRQDMEQRFGHDFSQVRVHTGGASEQSARDVRAHAYTVGHNVVFGASQFAPGTQEGRRLIAHELTHVVQQGATGFSDAATLHIAQDGRSEGIVNRPTDQVALGESVAGLTLGRAKLVVQRACDAEIGSVEGCIVRGGDITNFGESSDSIYLFDRNCDDFAPGERARLEDYAGDIVSDTSVDIDGFASEEGEPTFNENLSCARAQRAQEVISAVTGGQITVYKHGATPGERPTHRSAVITLHTPEPEPEPEPVDSAAPTPAESVTPAAPALPVPPDDCAAAAREMAPDCTPNPDGSHLPPVGRTHGEAHPLQPCLLTEAQVAASADWCVDRNQAHGGEVCYRQIPTAVGVPGDQYCYSLNCCHNSGDTVSTVDPASAGSGACCDNAGLGTTAEHIWEDVVPEFLDDPLRVIQDGTGIPIEDFFEDMVGP